MAHMESSGPLSKSIVVGSIATWLGKKAEAEKSHEWCVYVRAANPDEDLSTYIKKVNFVLHPTLQPPTRCAPRSPPTRPLRIATPPLHVLAAPHARVRPDARPRSTAPSHVLSSLRLCTVVESPPFEVIEQGWGEFEITLQACRRPIPTPCQLQLLTAHAVSRRLPADLLPRLAR